MGARLNNINKSLSKILLLLIILTLSEFIWIKSTVGFESSNSEPVNSTSGNSIENEPFTIGWSVYNSSYEFFHSMENGVLEKAEELGIKVIPHDQKSSTEEMVRGALNLLDQNVDALVISPFNPTAMPIIVARANEKNIPVIVVDVGTGGTDVVAFIISDSLGGGILAGEYALKLIKEHSISSKNAAIIKVEETSQYARRRGEGFKDVMEENGYQIVAEVTANSETDQAYAAMKNILESYKDDLAVVFCENDRMALGAAAAIEEAGKKGQIMVIGFDGDSSAIEAIKEGRMQGTVAQQPYKMGALGVEVAYKTLTDRKILFDDPAKKEIFEEIYLIDETGTPR